MDKEPRQTNWKGKIRTFRRVITPFYFVKGMNRPQYYRLTHGQDCANAIGSVTLASILAVGGVLYGIRVYDTGSWNIKEQSAIIQREKDEKERREIKNICTKVGYANPENVKGVLYFGNFVNQEKNGDGVIDYTLELNNGTKIDCLSKLEYKLSSQPTIEVLK